jgi:hypothetical protein
VKLKSIALTVAFIAAVLFCTVNVIRVANAQNEQNAQITDDQLRLLIANATIELQQRQITALSKENAELKKQLAELKAEKPVN